MFELVFRYTRERRQLMELRLDSSVMGRASTEAMRLRSHRIFERGLGLQYDSRPTISSPLAQEQTNSNPNSTTRPNPPTRSSTRTFPPLRNILASYTQNYRLRDSLIEEIHNADRNSLQEDSGSDSEEYSENGLEENNGNNSQINRD
jgi:hypothetical protein